MVTGVLTAESYQAAIRVLDDRALFPVEVKEGGEAEKTFGQRRGLQAEVGNFYWQLADLLNAGVALLRPVNVLQRQSSHRVLQ